MDYSMPIRWNFKKSLAAAQLTLDELSLQSGVGRNYLSLYARGRYNFNYEELSRIASILDVPVDRISG